MFKLNSVLSKSRSFILVMRWVMMGMGLLFYGLSGFSFHTYEVLAFIVFSGVNGILTICHFRQLRLKPVHWGLVHVIDLISISFIVLGGNGIRSESYNLYYLVVLQAGLLFGIRQALGCLLLGNVLYAGSVFLTAPTDGDIKKLALRIIYSWLVGITGSYMAYLEKKHHRHAITDCLTSTYNRSFLDQSLQYEFKQAINRKTSLSVIMIDIDNFKTVNDVYGHKIGDLVLEEVAGIIQSNIRDVDFVARYGGEEFFVTLPGIGCDKALEIAERIRRAVENAAFNRYNSVHRGLVTVSCGVASYPIQADNLDELMQKADEYLYEAKRAGRNRVYYKAG